MLSYDFYFLKPDSQQLHINNYNHLILNTFFFKMPQLINQYFKFF